MTLRVHVAAVAVIAVIAAACGRSAPAERSDPWITLTAPEGGRAFVAVNGLDPATLDRLGGTTRTPEQWASVLRIAVAAGSPPIIGDYIVEDDALRFTPTFAFDPGRQYVVRFNHAAAGGSGVLESTVALPGSTAVPSTMVTAVYPSGDMLPENLLRLYVHFSASMGRSSGIDHVELLDPDGAVVEGAFLPLDYEFWDADRQRFTVFLDPGRVKRGILPNRRRGRALRRGGRYTLVVKSTWRDENGLPLKAEFRKTFTAGPAEMQPLDTAGWKIDAPRTLDPSGSSRAGPLGPAGSLTVTFPRPLDHGLLMRALGVRRDGQNVDGDARLEAGETRWIFTPRDPWSPGTYELVALSILEDAAGNQIGRAFEVDNFEAVDQSPDPKTMAIRFEVGG